MNTKAPNFFEYQVGKVDKTANCDVVAQDQDTVIGDAMCHAAQIVYDVANQIARCIGENAQYAINMKDLRKAELALAYMQGVDFGLAIDVKRDKTYLLYMERTMASIRRSKEAGFQLQIDIPPRPSDFLKYDENHCRAMGDLFLRSLKDAPPDEKLIQTSEEEMYKEEGKDPSKFIPDPNDPTGRTLVMADNIHLSKAEDVAIEKRRNPKAMRNTIVNGKKSMEEDSANKKAIISNDIQDAAKSADVSIKKLSIEYCNDEEFGEGWVVHISLSKDGDVADKFELVNKILDSLKNNGYVVTEAISPKTKEFIFSFRIYTDTSSNIGIASDTAPEVTRLRDLFRTKRIGKEAFCGGIATLMAAGVIGKSEFTRLSTLAR